MSTNRFVERLDSLLSPNATFTWSDTCTFERIPHTELLTYFLQHLCPHTLLNDSFVAWVPHANVLTRFLLKSNDTVGFLFQYFFELQFHTQICAKLALNCTRFIFSKIECHTFIRHSWYNFLSSGNRMPHSDLLTDFLLKSIVTYTDLLADCTVKSLQPLLTHTHTHAHNLL